MKQPTDYILYIKSFSVFGLVVFRFQLFNFSSRALFPKYAHALKFSLIFFFFFVNWDVAIFLLAPSLPLPNPQRKLQFKFCKCRPRSMKQK